MAKSSFWNQANRYRQSKKQKTIKPQFGPQTAFLQASTDICIYGGAAGGGKTTALLLCPLYYVGIEGFTATIFRRTYPEVTNPGGLLDKSRFYQSLGARLNSTSLTWHFKTSRIKFSHLNKPSDVRQHDGSEIALICFDELQSFEKEQFFYLLSRNRSTCGVRPHVRATCNPATNWLRDLIDWWIDPSTGLAIPERSGVVRWMVRDGNSIAWADEEQKARELYPDSSPLSFSFISASVFDNQILLNADPAYIGKLKNLHPIERDRLLYGNWNVKEEAGAIVDRNSIQIEPGSPPKMLRVCRFWDLAATEEDFKGSNPCYTASVKIGFDGDRYWILDATRNRFNPGKTNKLILAKAQADGYQCMVRWEMEGGSGGPRDSYYIKDMLQGFNAKGVKPRKEKVVRFRPFATAVFANKVVAIASSWTDALLDNYHNCPELKRWEWDWIDATSGAFDQIFQSNRTLVMPL